MPSIDPVAMTLLGNVLDAARKKDRETTNAALEALVEAMTDDATTATDLLMRIYREDVANEGSQMAVGVLIKHCGANPLAWKEDFARMSLGLAWATTMELVEQENLGKGLRTAQGGNYLHALASKSSVLLRQFVGVSANDEGVAHKSWLTQLTDEGDSVLHVLWKHANARGAGESQHLWNETQWLLSKGLGLDGRNLAGHDVIDLIGQAADRYPELLVVPLAGDNEALRCQVVAQCQARAMQTGTEPARGATRSLRL